MSSEQTIFGGPSAEELCGVPFCGILLSEGSHLHRPVLRILICLAVLAAASAGTAQQQIPAASMEALQEMFADIRDGLCEATDHFWHRGDFDRCIAVTRLIAEIDPHDVEAYDNAAWLMQNNFRDDEAEAMLLRGVLNNRDRYDLYFALGYYYYMHQRFDEAVDYLEIAASLDPPIFVRHQLAHAYELGGDTSAALSTWLCVEALNPGDIVPQNHIRRIMEGKPPVNMPAMVTRWREQRKAEEGRQ